MVKFIGACSGSIEGNIKTIKDIHYPKAGDRQSYISLDWVKIYTWVKVNGEYCREC